MVNFLDRFRLLQVIVEQNRTHHAPFTAQYENATKNATHSYGNGQFFVHRPVPKRGTLEDHTANGGGVVAGSGGEALNAVANNHVQNGSLKNLTMLSSLISAFSVEIA